MKPPCLLMSAAMLVVPLLGRLALGAMPATQPATRLDAPVSVAGESFYIYALADGLRGLNETQIGGEIDRLHQQFGGGNRYHRVGFALITPGLDQMRVICRVARKKQISIGIILAVQDKAQDYRPGSDVRSYQWRLDAAATRQTFDPSSHNLLMATPSRYNRSGSEEKAAEMKRRALELGLVMREFPEVVTVMNGPIEEELAGFPPGARGAEYLADYSPFAVAEFRDWLRHRGIYDDASGRNAGQGAPAEITGPWVMMDGKRRSPFYDDPDPAHGANRNKSFNATFGTHFTTWKLRYWDLEAFPDPMTDVGFDPAPASGQGAVEGGFDAPRKAENTPWWTAWSWDVLSRGKRYPPGNPGSPAFGFRQVMVAHLVQDLMDTAKNAGIPPELMFAHQIPAETVEERRDLSSASPAWTGYLPINGNVGITKFGSINPGFLTQYTTLNFKSRGWGIFEWHPLPGASRADPHLYQAAMRDLRMFYSHKAHHLMAGWWDINGVHAANATFPLDDSNFAKAIKDFLAACPDRPYPGAPSRR